MRLRVRGPSGQAVIMLSSNSTIGDLRAHITEATSIKQADIKVGYPPKPLLLERWTDDAALSALDIKLDGEQLIISQRIDTNQTSQKNAESRELDSKTPKVPLKTDPEPSTDLPTTETQPSTFSFSDVGIAPSHTLSSKGSLKKIPPLSLTRKSNSMTTEPPEVPLPAHGSTMVVRIMPDDNSCLFRAFNSAFFGSMDNMHELRSIIAQIIQSQAHKYPAVVLVSKLQSLYSFFSVPSAKCQLPQTCFHGLQRD